MKEREREWVRVDIPNAGDTNAFLHAIDRERGETDSPLEVQSG